MQLLGSCALEQGVRHMSGNSGYQYAERLLDDRVLLTTRNGIFQVRLYKGNRRYLYKSLKTRNLKVAREAARKLFYELERRKDQNLPLDRITFSKALNEYEKMRETQNKRGTYSQANKQNQQQTSDSMLRQIKRVNRFWHEYCGKKLIEEIDNSILPEYVNWRVDYYKSMPANKRPRNHSLTPSDKTLEWETTHALTVLKYANERGYRGQLQMPNYRFKAQRTKTRPAFTLPEYRRLVTEMRRWISEAKNKPSHHLYTRKLLRDYVLILANSGMRVGEANNLRESDVIMIDLDDGTQLYGFNVNGKTGKRVAVLRKTAKKYVDRCRKRNRDCATNTGSSSNPNPTAHNRKAKQQGDWLFRMADGNKIVTLIDQFNKVLKRAGLTHNTDGEKYSLYSLRHFYAVQALRNGKADVFDISRNMGATVQIIQDYYGRHATSRVLATRLGA